MPIGAIMALVYGTAGANAGFDCPMPIPAAIFESQLVDVEKALQSKSLAQMASRLEELDTQVPCLAQPLSPEQAGLYHLVKGVDLWIGKENTKAKLYFSAAKAASPSIGIPRQVFPAGHEIQETFGSAPALAETEEASSPGSQLYFDGEATALRPIYRPTIYQAKTAGKVVHSALLMPGEAVPELGTALPSPNAARPLGPAPASGGAASSASSGSFQGYYTSEVLGIPVALKLVEKGGRVSGTLGLEGVSYSIDGQLTDGELTGRMSEATTGMGSDFKALLLGDSLQLYEYRRKLFGGGIKEVIWTFQREEEPPRRSPVQAQQSPTHAQSTSGGVPSHSEGGRDSNLVGTWGYSDAYVSGSYSFASQTRMDFHSDGTYGSNSSVGGGGDFVSAVSSGQGSGGQWMTQDSHLYLRSGPESEWQRHGRYYIEGGKMLLTLESGDKEFWQRR
jgi:hypothetical protein